MLLDVKGSATCTLPVSFCSCRDSSSATAPIQATTSPESTLRGILRTATPAERVRLVVALSETGGTLRYIIVSLQARGRTGRWERGVLILAGDCLRDLSVIGWQQQNSRRTHLVTLLLVSEGGVVANCRALWRSLG